MTLAKKTLARMVDMHNKSDDLAIHASNRAMRQMSEEASRGGWHVDWTTFEATAGDPVEVRDAAGDVAFYQTMHTYRVDAVRIEEEDE